MCVQHLSFISGSQCLLSSLAHPHRTRRHCGCYASRVLSWSARCDSTGRPDWQKEDNHNSWFDLGHRFCFPMCICGTSYFFHLVYILFILMPESWYACCGPYHLRHIYWSYHCCRAHLSVGNYTACNSRSYGFAPTMVHSPILPQIKSDKLTGYLGLLHGVFSSNTSSNSVAPILTVSLHSEFLGVYR